MNNPADQVVDGAHARPDEDLWALLTEMRGEIGDLRTSLALANAELAELRNKQSAPVAVSEAPTELHSRRSLLKKAGVGAAATAAGVVALSKPAAAADGDPIEAGETAVATTPTVLTGAGSASRNVFTVEDAEQYGSSSNFSSSIGAYCTSETTENALFAYQEGSGPGNDTGYAIVAWANAGARAPLLLVDLPDPRNRGLSYRQGAVVFDTDENLWVCVESGTPGTWRKVVGPATAGAFHPMAPKRVYDTRYQDGILTNNESRTVSIKDGRIRDSSTIDVPDLVPEGATAITFNLAVTGTNAAGRMNITPGDATEFTGASINWSSPKSTLNNGTISTIDANRNVKVWCGGIAHCIIDVTGYYL